MQVVPALQDMPSSASGAVAEVGRRVKRWRERVTIPEGVSSHGPAPSYLQIDQQGKTPWTFACNEAER
eukprot:7687492-Pyramimonas_sp.AAC.1